MQASSMWYAYFRFYVDEVTIRDGLNQYCTEWENMQSIGYNYKEYKCYVDNPGGLEHWVGDMGGYIADRRETGFMDGSPSDAVFDQSLLMGSERVIADDIALLNGYKTDTKLIFRKITAQDAGIAHKVEFKCGVGQKIVHPVMYTLDHQQIEIVKQHSTGFVDNSDVDSYEIMVESGIPSLHGSQHSVVDATITDLSNLFNKDKDDWATLSTLGNAPTAGTLIIDMGSNFSNTAIELYNYHAGTLYSRTYVYHSMSASGGWVGFGDTGDVQDDFCFTAQGIEGRYIKIVCESRSYSAGWFSRAKLYRAIVS